MQHINNSINTIREVLRKHQNGVVLWSGGKDSTVLLDLVRQVSPHIPAVAFLEPWFPRKNKFIHNAAARMGVMVYTPEPADQTVYQQPDDERVALVSRYHIGGQQGLDMPKDVIPYRGSMDAGQWICALIHHLRRPKALSEWPWPVAFIGHKNGDEDPILGKIPLNTDYVRNEGDAADMSYPLREWTDDQVWDYIEQHHLPWDKGKYKNRQPKEDKRGNTDYVPACVRCVSRTEGKDVFCPLFQKRVPNMADKVPRTDTLVHPHYTPEHPEIQPEPVPA